MYLKMEGLLKANEALCRFLQFYVLQRESAIWNTHLLHLPFAVGCEKQQKLKESAGGRIFNNILGGRRFIL